MISYIVIREGRKWAVAIIRMPWSHIGTARKSQIRPIKEKPQTESALIGGGAKADFNIVVHECSKRDAVKWASLFNRELKRKKAA